MAGRLRSYTAWFGQGYFSMFVKHFNVKRFKERQVAPTDGFAGAASRDKKTIRVSRPANRTMTHIEYGFINMGKAGEDHIQARNGGNGG